MQQYDSNSVWSSAAGPFALAYACCTSHTACTHVARSMNICIDVQGQRAQRIEMLLLHEFYRRKFLLPDKLTAKDRDRLAASAGADADAEDAGKAPAQTLQLAAGLYASHAHCMGRWECQTAASRWLLTQGDRSQGRARIHVRLLNVQGSMQLSQQAPHTCPHGV